MPRSIVTVLLRRDAAVGGYRRLQNDSRVIIFPKCYRVASGNGYPQDRPQYLAAIGKESELYIFTIFHQTCHVFC